MTSFPISVRRQGARLAALALAAATAACTATPEGQVSRSGDVFDPYERSNRGIHEFNRDIDRLFIRPAATGYSSILPDEIEDGVNNFSENLAMPSVFVNAVLQGDLRTAGLATSRFLLNSTIGLGGFFDAATEFGIAEAEADFGETLHVWGMPEGAFIELPVLGPSTERDVAGKIVDLFTNPLSYSLPDPEKYYGTAASALSRLSDRGRYSDTVDQILYESADSYAQSRLIYLQNRRFELEGGAGDSYVDPYADGQAGATPAAPSDPYVDPYEDPYAE